MAAYAPCCEPEAKGKFRPKKQALPLRCDNWSSFLMCIRNNMTCIYVKENYVRARLLGISAHYSHISKIIKMLLGLTVIT